MRWKLKLGSGKESNVELLDVKNEIYRFRVDGKEVELKDVSSFAFSLLTDKTQLSFESWSSRQWRASQAEKLWILESQSFGEASQQGQSLVRSQMPGRILELCVKEGDQIKKDQKLIIMEAMKMENEILSEVDAKIKKLHVSKSQSVESDQILIELEL